MQQGYGERGSCTSREVRHFYAGPVTDDAAMTPQVDDRVTEVDDRATDADDAVVGTGSSPGDGLHAAMATIEEAEGVLGNVEAALERLESGQYLRCEICGAQLDPAILVNAPTLRRCVVHAS